MRTRSLKLLITLMGCGVLAAATWQIDPVHTSAQFAVRHMLISTVRGEFSGIRGTVEYDPADPTKASLDATIDATTVNTRETKRDADLKSANFFEVEKYPTITFKSKRVEAAGAGKLKVTGDLTLHGVTREVVLDVEGPSAEQKMGPMTRIGAMDNAAASEMFVELFMIGHIVLMREEHCRDAAHLFNPVDERFREAR